MSKLEQLIQEFCSNGVEYKELGDVLNYEQPSKYIVRSTNYNDDYETPVLTAGQTFILGYTNEDDGIYYATSENPAIIFDDFTASFHWVNFKFKVKSSAMKILTLGNNKIAYFRFVYHVMKQISYIPINHTRQWIEVYSKFKIPIPPLPVQHEIVRILDQFTLLTAELTAELTARKKQYEYYRDKLLTSSQIELRKVQLSQITLSITSGGTPTSANKTYYENGTIPWLRTQEVNFCDVYDTGIKITERGLKESSARLIPVNCVIVAMYGATVGKVAINKIPVTTNQACCNLEVDNSKAHYKYVYHYLVNKYKYIKSLGQGSQTNINMQIIKGLEITLPPLDVQQRIVDVLDNFEKICNDLNIGLPAEIEARKQQYEYYRDKLLTFKELAAS